MNPTDIDINAIKPPLKLIREWSKNIASKINASLYMRECYLRYGIEQGYIIGKQEQLAPIPSDYRALCAELVDAVDRLLSQGESPANPGQRLILTVHVEDLGAIADRARAALAAPQQGAPGDEELITTYCDARRVFYFEAAKGESDQEDRKEATVAGLRAVLARYNAQAVPAPVSERLPGKGDLCPLSMCWWYDHADGAWVNCDRTYGAHRGWRHWLPHWALPLPELKP